MPDIDDRLRAAIGSVPPSLVATALGKLSDPAADLLLPELRDQLGEHYDVPETPLAQGQALMPTFTERPHLTYLSDRIAQAVQDVENGKSRRLAIMMPPRSGKSLLATQVTPGWILARQPTWDVMLTSYSTSLAVSWGRQVRRWLTSGALGPHIGLAPDAGAVAEWETTDGGKFVSRSLRADLTGFGGKVLVIDDPHKGFADAHSKASRDAVWEFWTGTAQPRLTPVHLVIVIQTRWHEDDLIGRLLSDEYDGDPEDWEVIDFPAFAEGEDVLGRAEGEPLLSPLAEETVEEATERLNAVKRSIGSYAWSALYQQRPSPAKGAIFDAGWWKYWTTDPDLADEDGNVIYLDPATLARAQWVDSWDCAFKKTDTSDFVVGQRWARSGADRFLIAQERGRKSFTETVAAMEAWAKQNDPAGSPYGHLVHQRLVEDAANGPAVIDTLKRRVAGIKAIRAEVSKEARARAVTPEIESGNVFLPYPGQPGNAWVNDLLSEFRNFPNDAHDDQVDATTQALLFLRAATGGRISNPAARGGAGAVPQSRTAAAHTLARRR